MTPEGWSRATVGEVTTCCDYGLSCSLSTEPSGIPVLRMGNLRDGSIDTTDLKFVSADKVKATDLLTAGDILVNRTNSPALVGKIGLFTSNRSMTFASYLFRMRTAVSKAAPEWLAHLLNSPRYQAMLRDIATPGVSQANINRERLRAVELPVPSLGEQKKIGAILSSVDDAIEASQALIDQLGVVKKAMMAELLTRGLPGRHTRFKQTAIGALPESWEIVRLGDVLDGIDAGWSPQCESRAATADEWGVLKVSAVTSGTYLDVEQKALPTGLQPRLDAEVRVGDVLLARANGVLELVGRTVLVRTTRPRLMLSDKLLRLRAARDRLHSPYLCLALQSDAVRSRLLSTTGGSHMRNVSQVNLRALALPLPSLAEQDAIAAAFDFIDERLAAERKSLHALRQAKSALMAVLLTGEVRVKPDEDAA